MEKMINEILEMLYQEYISNGGGNIFDISGIILKHNQDPHEVGGYLVKMGWIENHQFRPNSFVGAISMRGIGKIHPEYIQDNTLKIISTLGLNGKSSIMEILDFETKDFFRAHQLAKLLEQKGFVSAFFTYNDVILSLTFEGKQFYDKHKADFN